MWGLLSGTIGRASHSLISHTKGERCRELGEVDLRATSSQRGKDLTRPVARVL